jgi:hypothetical protein
LVPVAVGEEMVESHVQSDHAVSELMRFYPFYIKTELNVIAIATTHNPNPLDLVCLVEVQVTSSPQLKGSCFKAISEGDRPSIF